MLRRRLLICVLLCSACFRPEPAVMPRREPPGRVMTVPPGCLANFAGAWKHADDATWRYAALDDGGTLELFAYRAFSTGLPDGGQPSVAESPSARVRLERNPNGFAGEAVADVLHPTGRICAARYPTEVQSCSEGGLVLRAAAAVSLGDGCQTPLPPRTPVMLEHRLVRADPRR